jgi:hypothetical protein
MQTFIVRISSRFVELPSNVALRGARLRLTWADWFGSVSVRGS